MLRRGWGEGHRLDTLQKINFPGKLILQVAMAPPSQLIAKGWYITTTFLVCLWQPFCLRAEVVTEATLAAILLRGGSPAPGGHLAWDTFHTNVTVCQLMLLPEV